MDKLLLSDWVTLITAIGVIVALVSNVLTLAGRGTNRATELIEMKQDIKHIKESVDKMSDIPNRVTILEQDVKNINSRIGYKGGGGNG